MNRWKLLMPGSLKTDRRGQALVEFVLVLPVLLLLLIGIITYGLYIAAAATVQQAARVGARSAAIGETLGCPGQSAQTQIANGDTPTVYGEVDDQLNHDQPWLSTHTKGSPLPVISFAAQAPQSSTSANSNMWITVAYAYHPLVPAPGLPDPTEIFTTYQVMVQTAQPSDGLSSTLPTGSPYDETTQWTQPAPPSSMSYLVQPGGC